MKEEVEDDYELIEVLDNDEELNMIMEKYNINQNSVKKTTKQDFQITGRDIAEMIGLTEIYDKSKK